MLREYVRSEALPGKPHNSPAVKIGNLVFCSGQTADGTIEEATRTSLANLKTVLDAAGSGLDKIVKANVWLATMDDYAAMNAIYTSIVPSPMPARTCISPAKLPNNAVIEIECIAEVEG